MSQSRLDESSDSFSINNSFNNNTNSFNNVYNVNSSSDERAEVLAWLSPLEPRVRHQDIRAHRVGGVGDWLLRTDEYMNWVNGIRYGGRNNSTLFCCGDPGVGKT